VTTAVTVAIPAGWSNSHFFDPRPRAANPVVGRVMRRERVAFKTNTVKKAENYLILYRITIAIYFS